MLDFNQAKKAIQSTNNILILPSNPLDGDSLGSALALFHALKKMGKNATVSIATDIPDILKFLPGSQEIVTNASVYADFVVSVDLRDIKAKEVRHEIVENKINIFITPESGTLNSDQVSFPELPKKFDLLLIVDCASLSQLGDFYTQNYNLFGQVPSINFDHHETNQNFASLNLVDPSACSTTSILLEFFKILEVDITPDIATLLLAGIITDTGSFQNPNTSPEAFDTAASLIDKGARQQEIIKNVYKTKAMETLKLWGRILSNIKIDEPNKIVWATVTTQDFRDTGTTDHNTGDIIDELLSNAEEAEVVLLLEEKPDGVLHGSLRTTSDKCDVSKIAEIFGGGGHKQAAGFNIPNATVASKEQEILDAIRNFNKPADTKPAVEPQKEPATKPAETSTSPTPEPTPAPSPDQKDDAKKIEKMAINFVSGQNVTDPKSSADPKPLADLAPPATPVLNATPAPKVEEPPIV